MIESDEDDRIRPGTGRSRAATGCRHGKLRVISSQAVRRPFCATLVVVHDLKRMTRVVVQTPRIVKPRPSHGDGDLPAHNIIPLSSADFAMPNYYTQSIYAFESPTPPTSELEEGMANLLPLFRVYAGTLTTDHNGRLAIDPSDQGVAFLEAFADGILADAMPFDPTPSLLQFLPPTEGVSELLLIQLTRFTCGGLGIGVAINHMLGDGLTSVGFLNCWGMTVRGEPLNYMPVHDRSLLMARNPPRPIFDLVEYATRSSIQDSKWDLVIKKFSFTGELVNRVRTIASQNAEKPYSRYVSLVAHAWRCISRARGLDGEVVTSAFIAVNGRDRLSPPLPAGYVGNAIFRVCAETTVRELTEQPLGFVADLIRKAIARVDDEYMRSAMDQLEIIVGKDGPPPPLYSTPVRVSNPHIKASSWMILPFYDLDFGWGKPVYAGPGRYSDEGNLIFFPPRGTDGGMNVKVALFEPHMASFEERIYDI